LHSLRVPVQYRQDKAVLGRVHGGVLDRGDEVVCLPSGEKAVVRKVKRGEETLERAGTGDSLRIEFDSVPELERGHVLVSEGAYPNCSSELDATLLWIGTEAPGDHPSYRIYHQSHLVDAQIATVKSCLQPESYEWSEGDNLAQGKVGHVHLTTASPLYFDSFFQSRRIGRFVLLHPDELRVVGLGILRDELRKRHEVTSTPERLASKHVVIDPTEVDQKQRCEKYGHRGAVLWFTGLSASGKSAAAKKTEKALYERGCHTLFLDGDNVRTGFNGDLGFTQEARSESNRRVAELAALAYQQGQIVICSFISGGKEERDFARSLVGQNFYLFHVDCPVEVCRDRDPKGLYEKAEAGELLSFTGVSLPYEKPTNAELVLDSTKHDPETLSSLVVEMLESDGVISTG
ncbi:MAG: adenylyl-sulfate kinase, partial [Candidatus Eremiobacteraeota bacterium]|nr:adenylyl-sulfate kinase [Candidatus Eremiobacteraeota bacterium]